MEDSDIDYDTEAVSLASTIESANEGVYDIKGILSEGWGENTYGKSVMKYLIEWDGYPMHM
jgi:chromo domain-containing protein 1